MGVSENDFTRTRASALECAPPGPFSLLPRHAPCGVPQPGSEDRRRVRRVLPQLLPAGRPGPELAGRWPLLPGSLSLCLCLQVGEPTLHPSPRPHFGHRPGVSPPETAQPGAPPVSCCILTDAAVSDQAGDPGLLVEEQGLCPPANQH